MKATTNDPRKPDANQVFVEFKRRRAAEQVKKQLCAYFDPDRRVFGKASRCLDCLCNGKGEYEPDNLDTDCKRHKIIEDVIPSLDVALALYL